VSQASITPARLRLATISRSLRSGLRTANLSRRVSLLYSTLVALVGLLIMSGLWLNGMAPLIPMAAAAFMLVAPLLLAGFFGVARAIEGGRTAGVTDVIHGFRHAPPVVLAISLVCTLLFMIFATDIAILYSYKIGSAITIPLELWQSAGRIADLWWWGGVSGAFIGIIVFSISAFSLPLLCERRAGLVQSVSASVYAVITNPLVSLTWAVLITVATVVSVLVLPILPLTLPILAYASHALYREMFGS